MNNRHQQILSAVLSQIPTHGWTDLAFKQGAKASGLTVADARKAFPGGIADIVTAFQQSIDDAMLARIKAKRNFPTLRVRDKITFAIRARLEIVEPHREAVRRLMVWAVMPRNLRQSTKQLWHAADIIWLAAGDDSTDYNYYTKRGLLIAVMKATMSFWLGDLSHDYQETWEFLDRRIEDVMKVGKGISIAKTLGMSDILSFVKSRFAA